MLCLATPVGNKIATVKRLIHGRLNADVSRRCDHATLARTFDSLLDLSAGSLGNHGRPWPVVGERLGERDADLRVVHEKIDVGRREGRVTVMLYGR